MTSPYPRIGAAIERAYSDALGKWCKDNAKGRPFIEAVTSDVSEVQLNATLRRSGQSLVVVSIDARRPWNQLVEAYALEGTPWVALSDILTA